MRHAAVPAGLGWAAGPPRQSRAPGLRQAGHALVDGMVLWRRELGALVGFLGVVAVEPVLTWLEAADERVPGGRGVGGGVLHGRGVAAANVPALRAPAQVHPPAARGLALDAPGAARRHRGVDARYLRHLALLRIV